MAITIDAINQEDGSYDALQELQAELVKVSGSVCVACGKANMRSHACVRIASAYRISLCQQSQGIQDVEAQHSVVLLPND